MKSEVKSIFPGSGDIELKPDLAAEHPLYLYYRPGLVLYSTSIKNLLRDERVSVEACPNGISFLLQSGAVPPPHTVYKNIYILGVGDVARIKTTRSSTTHSRTTGALEQSLTVSFDHQFPFASSFTNVATQEPPDAEDILNSLAGVLDGRLCEDRRGFLFHSAGKDSNMIALAAVRSEYKEQITCITHKSKGKADESEMSAAIARKLGLRHQILYEMDRLDNPQLDAINQFFNDAPLPGVDPVTLAYPVYTTQIPELVGASIIDGGGNDCYMMTPTSLKERYVLPLLRYSAMAPGLRRKIATESHLGPVLKTPAEFYGMSGLSYADARAVYEGAVDHSAFWKSKTPSGNQDWIQHKTDIHTTITAAEVHIRKVRNFADSVDADLILPFANAKVASHFIHLNQSQLFDRKTGKNKLLIRKILMEKLGLDSDAVGKMGYSYDFGSVIEFNRDFIYSHIQACSLWNQTKMEVLLDRLQKVFSSRHKYAKLCGRMIYRIFLISAWYQNCRYLSRKEVVI